MSKSISKIGLFCLHLFAVGVALYTIVQGKTGYYAVDTFDPGLASGKWAVRFLLFSLSMTPLQTFIRWNQASRFRKPSGLWSFGFALLHIVYYFQEAGFNWGALFQTGFLVQGLIGFLILAALAITSNRWAMRRLKKNWKRLHRLVYLAGGVVTIHALLAISMSKKMLIRDPQAVYELPIYLALLVLLLLARIPLVIRAFHRVQRETADPIPIQIFSGKKAGDEIQVRYLDFGENGSRQVRAANPREEKEGAAGPQPPERIAR